MVIMVDRLLYDFVSKVKLEYIELRNGFLATLSEADRILFTLREEGKTQKEIADQLGYKTHSAVSKRLQTMRGRFEEYMRTQQ